MSTLTTSIQYCTGILAKAVSLELRQRAFSFVSKKLERKKHNYFLLADDIVYEDYLKESIFKIPCTKN